MDDLKELVIRIDDRSKGNSHRLDELEKRQDNLDGIVSSVKVLATKQDAMDADVKEIKVDVKKLSTKPGKRWDAIVDKLVWAVLAAFVAYILAKFGL